MSKPFVFVLMEFSDEFDDAYELGIKPACEAADTNCQRVDEQIFIESILERIYRQIERADIVVAEMTGRNPNVFYEVGYAHGIGKPVILLTKSADDIPFDLRQYPHVIWSGGITTLKRELEKRVSAIAGNPERAIAASLRSQQIAHANMEKMAAHIDNYIKANGFEMMSFQAVREYVNETYSDDMLKSLIADNPDRYRRVKIKGNLPGIGLVDS